jgi:ATP-binding cassette, subfamily B, beta-glucan exporter
MPASPRSLYKPGLDERSPVNLLKTYLKALALLAPEKRLASGLVLANVAIGLVQLLEPILFGRVVDALAGGKAAFPLIGLWAGLGLFSILGGVVVAVAADRLAHRQRLSVLANVFERVITLPVAFHAERGSGTLVRTLLAGSDALFWMWLTFLREHLAALVSIGFLIPTAIAMQPLLAAILGVLSIIYVVANVIVVQRTTGGQDAVERYNQDVFGRVGDVLGNVSVVQSFARLNAETSALRSLMGHLLKVQYPVLTWWAILTVMTRASATITMVAIFSVGALLAEQGAVTVGEIVSFVGFATLLIGKLDQLSSFVSRIFNQTPTIENFFHLLEAPGATIEAPDAVELKVNGGHVIYEDISFQFPGSTQGVFGIDFEVPPGATIALVGATGSGKTTTLTFLQRLRDPDQGRITIDGQDIREVTLKSLRDSIGIVFQEAGLFNRSIAENILIGRPGATQDEVIAAARLAEAEEFIEKKPGGFGFVIGERGGALSGGERQRLAIARALLKNAPILILDEATSALDTGTEAKIKRALDALRRGRTTFIIAHRLSTVAHADQILVLEQGRILERGTFRELVALNGLFAQMVRDGGFQEPEPPTPS